MHAPGVRIDLFLQGIGIGGLQFGELAPVQHPGRQVMALGGKVVEHVGTGGPGPGLALLAAGQAHFLEQDFAQLLGAADIELMPRQLVNFGLELG